MVATCFFGEWQKTEGDFLLFCGGRGGFELWIFLHGLDIMVPSLFCPPGGIPGEVRSVKKRTVILILLLCLCLGRATDVSAAGSGLPFTDVYRSDYYYDAVAWALENGITTGTSRTAFSPETTCTRGQVVTFLWRLQGEPEPAATGNSFSDVSPAQYYCRAVQWAVENGITNGTSDIAFSPDAVCTRAQVLTFLWRTENRPQPDGRSSLAGAYAGQYYEQAVAWADTSELISGTGNAVFDPEGGCPRSEIVTYLYRFSLRNTGTGSAGYVKLTPESPSEFDLSDVPVYSGAPFVRMNGNCPYFSSENLSAEAYEMYGALDSLGRCTACVACVGTELMPDEPRGEIGQIRPTGWHTVKYDCVDGKYLYNRCHLIGYQLTGENANPRNLITGTRYLNLNMRDFENLVAEFAEDCGMHVLYRVTPVFKGENLVASGVLLEGMSVEDRGSSVRFCVFLYNVQPGIAIDYATGSSSESTATADGEEISSGGANLYILNTATYRFHRPECSSAAKMSIGNRREYTGSREDVIRMGYEPCRNCNP